MNKYYIDRGWRFSETFEESMITAPMAGGTEVCLPHTVKEVPFNYFDESVYQMVSGYQRRLAAPLAWQGKRVCLTLEGAAHEATVWVNGTLIGTHKSGYTAFTAEISEQLRYGAENLITVRLDSRESLDQPPFGFVIDYMTFGGLYRDAYITVQEPVCLTDVFAMPGFAVQPETEGFLPENWEEYELPGELRSLLTLSPAALEALAAGRLSVRQTLRPIKVMEGPHKKEVLFESRLTPDMNLREGGVLPLKVTRPFTVRPWDVESPYIYRIRTELYLDGEKVDVRDVLTGFRSARFTADGFYLNGRLLKIRGLNRHQSYPYVGYAMPSSMQIEDARICKQELGLNAVRTSHYPQLHDFISACDLLGLLVFTEIPGWQHIGGEAWQAQALENVREMITQYRNHPSIVLWGVRINESRDCDELYTKTNALAHELDPTRQTGGVRCEQKMNLLEDVYTYNDFSFDGDRSANGLRKKKDVTPDMSRPYMVTEYAGHMYPTKTFDAEEHRLEHLYRHAKVLEAAAADPEICGSFGWCMFDYNTHQDFGSGDRICYHGVMDMFRNPKLPAALYAAQGLEEPVLEVSSSMDIGEHPATVRGETYLVTNADSVRMYKNDELIKEYRLPDPAFRHMKHGLIRLDDFIEQSMAEKEGFDEKTAQMIRECLNETAIHGFRMTPKVTALAGRLMAFHHLTMADAKRLFETYIGDWGGRSRVYRFEAVKDGEVVKTVIKTPAKGPVRLQTRLSQKKLKETRTYDVAEIRVSAVDEHDNVLPFFTEAVSVETEGPVRVIGPAVHVLRGGMTGIYVRSEGQEGAAKIRLTCAGCEPVELTLKVERKDDHA